MSTHHAIADLLEQDELRKMKEPLDEQDCDNLLLLMQELRILIKQQ